MKNFINRALVAKKKLKLLFAKLALHVNLVAKKGAFVWHPKTAILRWSKWRHFHADFRPFSPLFFSIFQPIFGCSQNSVRGSLTTRLAFDQH